MFEINGKKYKQKSNIKYYNKQESLGTRLEKEHLLYILRVYFG